MDRKTLIGLITGTAVCLTLAGTFIPAGAQDTDQGMPAPNRAVPAAQAGTSFTFQGQLKKNGGAFNGACSFRFTLFDAATSGIQIDTPRTVNTIVTNGLFTAELDFGNQFTGQARWLQTAVKCAGDADFIAQNPRLNMTSSPYALGLIPGASINGSGSVGLAANTPNGNALRGTSESQVGVYGESATNVGVMGKTKGNWIGVYGESVSGAGVWGESATGAGVVGNSKGAWIGVYGESAQYHGIVGTAFSQYHGGVVGENKGNGFGVYGLSAGNGAGVWGESKGSGAGVRGHSLSSAGVYGTSTGAFGVYGEATDNYAIKGKSLNSVGVYGESTNSAGLYGFSAQYDGVIGRTTNPARYAVYADGKVAITGGTDVAERFSSASEQTIEPGTVIVVDEAHPGQISPSGAAYDPAVVGIVSGAGGVEPGLVLHQKGMMEGPHIVAIAGRVYVKATAANGAIKPGDLLTSSDLLGHAMKATDRDRAFGAIIGKALTGLDSGSGLVLVLVNLQ